jgi:hypothetical protein
MDAFNILLGIANVTSQWVIAFALLAMVFKRR